MNTEEEARVKRHLHLNMRIGTVNGVLTALLSLLLVILLLIIIGNILTR